MNSHIIDFIRSLLTYTGGSISQQFGGFTIQNFPILSSCLDPAESDAAAMIFRGPTEQNLSFRHYSQLAPFNRLALCVIKLDGYMAFFRQLAMDVGLAPEGIGNHLNGEGVSLVCYRLHA